MDPHEKLKVARHIKEEGNDYFKKGILPEAQKCYTKVLEMLREEITLTGDDQKKEEVSLILAAHLNLAQCALRLGDYVKVMDHCNTALGLDSNNVKAHFRRAKAFENLSEYAKAIEGYQTVLRLEPNNSAAQKQLCECQKKLAKERSVKQMSHNTGVIEVEMVHESCEGEFESFYKTCKKNPGHKEFIDVADFEINNLPPDYRDEDLFAFVKHQIQLTVLVEVKGSSEHRPEYDPDSGDKYPFSGKRYRRSIHRGTGWVSWVDIYNGDKPCPCTTCQSSGMPEKHWAEIYINTARHVVYDEIEIRKAVCYFFYDTKVQLKSCPNIRNGLETSKHWFDSTILTFFSHDQKLIDILNKEWHLFNQFLFTIQTKYNNGPLVKRGADIIDTCVQNDQRMEELTTEFRNIMDEIKAIFNGDPATEYEKCKQRKTGVSGFLHHMLLDKLNGGSKFQRQVEVLSGIYKGFESDASEIKNARFRINAIRHGLLPLTEQTKGWLEVEHLRLHKFIERYEKFVNAFRTLLTGNELLPTFCLDDYNKAHPLTIIVSHPHGLSKKISIGEVTDRHIRQKGSFTRFIYSTPTCPGSSGAAVFVLGHKKSDEPAHSCGESVEAGGKQRNMSVFDAN